MNQVIYAERSRNPFAQLVQLTEEGLKANYRTTPLSELHLAAMADAYRRGRWLGGGGSERGLEELPEGQGIVPVTRVTGTTKPIKVRRAAEFAQHLGELALRHSGGAARVAALATQADVEGVPLWLARRSAPGPAGPVTVAVDRRLIRVDVWGPYAPAVRIRAPHGLITTDTSPGRGLVLTVGDAPVSLLLTKVWRKSRSFVRAQTPQGHWELRRVTSFSSELLRDGRRVALLTRPERRRRPVPDTVLLPLTEIDHDTPDPLDAVMAHAFAVTFGLGDTTGAYRFRAQKPRHARSGEPVAVEWGDPWFSNLGWGSDDNDSGGGDGWGSDGGDGGDGSGGDGGGGDGGGGDGGGGGGD